MSIEDGEFRALLDQALCVGFPSTTEGFGLPPLEGMTVGCPAVLAPCGALPEIGGEAAISITNKMDIRGGFNALSYSRNFNKDGVAYAGQLSFRSIEAHYDWFPFAGSFHLSPGLLVYNGNKVTANASVTGGQTFDLDNTTYSSDPNNPVTGKGKIDGAKIEDTWVVKRLDK